ncbi:MAG: DUF3325 domain-containing protein [Acidobacteria bacterium]|nr:DUF3325 domain-containing protein [Acidobacteriota bacterium]MYH28003.1 DUF3325 domain-containing protein [Acidobacteriota bacterium]MYK88111.1 DUF3325 domain-containing protein [Acidobacteriota bacterium]
MTLAAFALSYAGLATLGLSQARHHRRVYGREPSSRRRRAGRSAGWILLAASAAATARAWGPAMAAVAFPGVVTVTAVAAALLLTYSPQAVAPIRVAAAVGAVASLWVGFFG